MSKPWSVAWAATRARREQQQKRIAELEAEVERLRTLNERQVALVEQARTERDESGAEIERLRTALERDEQVILAARAMYRDFTDRDAWIAVGKALAALDRAKEC